MGACLRTNSTKLRMSARNKSAAAPQIRTQAKSKPYCLKIFISDVEKRKECCAGILKPARNHAEPQKRYLASVPVRIPSPSVNVEPTLPTTADLRVSPIRSRNR